MKKITKLIPLILSFSLSICLTSCANLVGGTSSSSNKTVVFHGSFSIDESFITENSTFAITSRSAQPTLPVIPNNKYYAKATNGIDDPIISEDINATTGTFSIPLKTGSTWTIEVGANGTSAVNSSNTNAVLIKDTKVFNPANDEPTKDYKFYLTPQITDGGTGKLNLRIKIQDPSGNKITKVEIVPKKCLNKPDDTTAVTAGWSGLSNWDSTKKAVIYTSSLSEFTISSNTGFTSGIWEVAVNFKDNEEQLLYSSIQIICVYDNLETKTWESSKTVADSNELIVSSGSDAGVMYLTTLLVDAYGLTDFYVSSTGNDTTGNGSPMKPFATITKGIAVVNGLNRLDKTYTLHVKNGISQTVSSTITVTSNLSIECYQTREGDRAGTATITSTCTDGPILQIGDGNTTSVLTIDGIRNTRNTPDISDDTWTGLQLVSNRSTFGTATRGVEIKGKGSFFMNGGLIKSNKCNNQGAGVYISENGYFIFTGGRITGNNSVTAHGGGIYIHSGGDLLIKGGVITDNTASAGAGICADGDITIGGTCYISGNSTGSTPTNIYLPDYKLIKISGNIDGSTIGITTQSTPTAATPIRFTDGYSYNKEWGQNGNNLPSKYFTSDKSGFSVITDTTQDDPDTSEDENNGDAYLGISGGTITQFVTPQLTISISKNGNEYTISATSTDTEWTGCSSENTNAALKYYGTVIAKDTFWTYDAENCKVTLLDTLPAGTYVLEVDVTYNSRVYSATFNITKS